MIWIKTHMVGLAVVAWFAAGLGFVLDGSPSSAVPLGLASLLLVLVTMRERRVR